MFFESFSTADVRRYQGVAKAILRHPEPFDWTIQGLGMLRTKVGRALRLHVWADQAKYPGIAGSATHTHPWDLESLILSGSVTDVELLERSEDYPRVNMYHKQQIECGPGGCAKGEIQPVYLQVATINYVQAADSYAHTADHIHRSEPKDGAVSIIYREPNKGADLACVYWNADTEWVSAEPRAATTEEIRAICNNALVKWDDRQ